MVTTLSLDEVFRFTGNHPKELHSFIEQLVECRAWLQRQRDLKTKFIDFLQIKMPIKSNCSI